MSGSPIRELRDEHELVLVMVEAMEREVVFIGTYGGVDVGRVAQMIDFARSFTDCCHHAKEECLLFPRLKEREPTAGGAVSVMLVEHEAERRAIRAIDEALANANEDGAARATVTGNLAVYASLLRLHINKENAVLFPLADRVLDADDQERLAGEFERLEREEMGAGAHARYRALACELAHSAQDDAA